VCTALLRVCGVAMGAAAHGLLLVVETPSGNFGAARRIADASETA